jgi:hypothetical protein
MSLAREWRPLVCQWQPSYESSGMLSALAHSYLWTPCNFMTGSPHLSMVQSIGD